MYNVQYMYKIAYEMSMYIVHNDITMYDCLSIAYE